MAGRPDHRGRHILITDQHNRAVQEIGGEALEGA